MSVCVCVRERERDKEKERESLNARRRTLFVLLRFQNNLSCSQTKKARQFRVNHPREPRAFKRASLFDELCC